MNGIIDDSQGTNDQLFNSNVDDSEFDAYSIFFTSTILLISEFFGRRISSTTTKTATTSS